MEPSRVTFGRQPKGYTKWRGVLTRIPPELDHVLRNRMVQEDRPLAWLVRQALWQYLEATDDVEGASRAGSGRRPEDYSEWGATLIRMPPELQVALQERLERADKPLAWLMRPALQRYLGREDTRTAVAS